MRKYALLDLTIWMIQASVPDFGGNRPCGLNIGEVVGMTLRMKSDTIERVQTIPTGASVEEFPRWHVLNFELKSIKMKETIIITAEFIDR